MCLLVCDVGAVFAAFLCGTYLRVGALEFRYVVQPIVWLSYIAFIGSFYIFDLYSPFKYFRPVQTAVEIFYSVFVGSLILAAASYFDRSLLIARPIFVMAVCFLVLFVFCIRMLYDLLFRFRLFDKRTVIVGAGPLEYEVARLIRRTSYSGIRVLGLIGVASSSHEKKGSTLPILGTTSELLRVINLHNVQLVILAMELSETSSESDMIGTLFNQPVQVVSAIQLFEKLERSVPCRLVNEHYILTLIEEAKRKQYLKVKRMLDVLCSLVLLVVLLPVSLLTVLLLSFQDMKRIFFVQKRIGRNRHPFQLFKFRSMIQGGDGKKIISGLGKWLRKYRIDELPQIVNVLKGDMSLVGPRPETDNFIERSYRYIPSYHAIFALRPGITGWAQVNFKHTTSERGYEKKFCYDLYYLKNFSLTLDVSVLLKTIGIILRGKGR